MDCAAVKAVPFYHGAWREVGVPGSVAGWDTEASVIVSDVVFYDICGVEVSLLPVSLVPVCPGCWGVRKRSGGKAGTKPFNHFVEGI